jgi:cytochrome c biogenesis protein CcmG/thiol:disulfide interchange protein DsbE
MKAKKPILFFAAILLMALAFSIIVATKSGSAGANAAGGAADWEFPRDWFLHDNDQQRNEHTVLLGKPMPLLELLQWENGQVNVEQMKGKVVVIDFWATWCGPCLEAVPHNNELFEKYRRQGLEMIGVCTAEGQENYQQTIKDKGFKYPTARDADLKTAQAWHVLWFPTYAVIDRKGNLRAIGIAGEYVERVVQKLLAEPAS